MRKIRLGVNIDHVATIRNARGEYYPEPVKAAIEVEKSGADSITVHLREDRRHINDNDLKEIKKRIKIPLNLEMAATNAMLKIAIRIKPKYVCLVPEKRQEVTTEGGLNLKKNRAKILNVISALKKNDIRVSLFIEPSLSDIKIAKKINSDCVELHTGKYCNLFNRKFKTKFEFYKLRKAALYANQLGLEVHAGHGLSYKTTKNICKIKNISEINIGHFIISESIFHGMSKIVKKFKFIVRN